MGLDMSLEGRRHNWGTTESDEGFPVKSKTYELAYWRKHPNLHGYIVKNYAKDGVDDCEPVELDQDALIAIMAAVREDRLPQTSGFFFGSSRESTEQRDHDLAVLTRALFWLQNESKDDWRTVIYQASW
jgi:hypothetical protein